MMLKILKSNRTRTLQLSFTERELSHYLDKIEICLGSYYDIKSIGRDTFVLPYKHFNHVLNKFDWLSIEIYGDLPKDVRNYVETRNELATRVDNSLEYVPKTKSFPHQLESFKYAQTKNNFLLADEQGLGKTKMAIDIASSRRSEFRHCLVVCGVSSLRWNWNKEIGIHSHYNAHVVGSRVTNTGSIVVDSVKERTKDLLSNRDEFFLIVNIETLRDKKFAEAVNKLTKHGTIGMAVIDEFHKCKLGSSSQGKAIHKIESMYKLAMTGTPLMDNPLDLHNLLKWLQVESKTMTEFKQVYTISEMSGQVIEYRNLEYLHEVLADNMLRRRKHEVLDLPEKIYTTDWVVLSPKQFVLYNSVKQGIQSNIDKVTLSENPLASVTRLRQATGNPSILTSDNIPNAKFERAREIVSEAVELGQQVIVYSIWEMVISQFYRELEHSSKLVTSQISSEEKFEVIREFQEDGTMDVICGTVASLGTGFTLTKASVVVFLDSPWSKANKDQAEDRAHRIGTVGSVSIHTLVAQGTIDERIEEIVNDKGEMSNYLVDGEITPKYAELLLQEELN